MFKCLSTLKLKAVPQWQWWLPIYFTLKSESVSFSASLGSRAAVWVCCIPEGKVSFLTTLFLSLTASHGTISGIPCTLPCAKLSRENSTALNRSLHYNLTANVIVFKSKLAGLHNCKQFSRCYNSKVAKLLKLLFFFPSSSIFQILHVIRKCSNLGSSLKICLLLVRH